jgi:hypothetical protein
VTRGWLLLGLACLLGWGGPGRANTVRATLSLEYDDNLFEYQKSRRSGWISRLYLSSASRLLDRKWGNLQVQHQWGIKRFWRSEEAAGTPGDVVANYLELGGVLRLREGLQASWASELKIKSVQQISSEESYLRGGLRLGLNGHWGERLTGGIGYRRSGDEARDPQLADVSMHEGSANLSYARSRRLRGSLGFRWRRLNYGRPALMGGDEEEENGVDQEDVGREWSAGVQLYRGVLVHAQYAFIDNSSNSMGYGFSAHRMQLMLTRHLGKGVDGQLFFTSQVRRYDEVELTEPAASEGGRDEYEQTLFSLKLARRLGERYDLSWQYRSSRNGSRAGDGFFRKKVYSLAIDMGI